jgi:hypothetical protein
MFDDLGWNEVRFGCIYYGPNVSLESKGTHVVQNNIRLYIQVYILLFKMNCKIYFVRTISRTFIIYIYFILFCMIHLYYLIN